jgi:hypothetical protein
MDSDPTLPSALVAALAIAQEHGDALGFLAGRMAQRPRARRSLDPSSFLMDRELFVREAAGQSILRLPWFEEDLRRTEGAGDLRIPQARHAALPRALPRRSPR